MDHVFYSTNMVILNFNLSNICVIVHGINNIYLSTFQKNNIWGRLIIVFVFAVTKRVKPLNLESMKLVSLVRNRLIPVNVVQLRPGEFLESNLLRLLYFKQTKENHFLEGMIIVP